MRLSDRLWGAILFLLGTVVAALALKFPPAPGQPVGPGMFPLLIGGGLALAGVTMICSGWRAREVGWGETEEWVGQPRLMLRFALVIGALVFYALAVDTLGFFITAFALLAVLLASFGVRRRWIAPLAAGTTLLLHFAFYTGLRVPLPWGWLEGIAW